MLLCALGCPAPPSHPSHSLLGFWQPITQNLGPLGSVAPHFIHQDVLLPYAQSQQHPFSGCLCASSLPDSHAHASQMKLQHDQHDS